MILNIFEWKISLKVHGCSETFLNVQKRKIIFKVLELNDHPWFSIKKQTNLIDDGLDDFRVWKWKHNNNNFLHSIISIPLIL